MNTLTTARALITVAGGVPAHATILMTAAALISATGRKAAASSATVTGRVITSATVRKSASSSVLTTGKVLTSTSTRKSAAGGVSISGKLLTSSTGRKGGAASVRLTGVPIILLGKHAYVSFIMSARAITSASGQASATAFLLRDERTTGYLDEGGVGHLVGDHATGFVADTVAGRIEP